MTLDVTQLDRLVAQIPHEMLSSRRWFRSKGRPIADLALEDAAPLVADPGARDAVVLIVRVSFADGGPDELYLLPMLSEPDVPGASPAEAWGIVAVRDAATGIVLREPGDGDGVWTHLLAGFAAEVTLPALHGSFVFYSLQPIQQLLEERRLSGEQSNTSVALGDRLLLKLYRRLEPGENPDLELPRFLTEAGFDRVPAVAGFVRYIPTRGEPIAAAMLQAFLPDAIDAWRWLLNELTIEREPDGALEAVGRIGAITARMHAALASRPDDPAFPARAASPDDLHAWRASADEQLDRAIAADGRVAQDAQSIRTTFDAIDRARDARVSRIHGDYHLGQLLRTATGFTVIDFEGEPARPLADRRRPNSPLKDVAGMLRSLDYAARTVERNEAASGFDPEGWLVEAHEAFLQAYRSGGMPLDDELLRAFELEKACYEVHYEANNRPDWVWLPRQALERLTRREVQRR
jgi:Uncharacterized protein, probably involved in trehalose biosynthesis